jgi:hypothetical protein
MNLIGMIKVDDGLEQNTERIISFINGDSYIQMSGFFSLCEIQALAEYLAPPQHHCHCEQCQPFHPPD